MDKFTRAMFNRSTDDSVLFPMMEATTVETVETHFPAFLSGAVLEDCIRLFCAGQPQWRLEWFLPAE